MVYGARSLAIEATATRPYFFRIKGVGIVASMDSVARHGDRYAAERTAPPEVSVAVDDLLPTG